MMRATNYEDMIKGSPIHIRSLGKFEEQNHRF